MKRTNLFGCIAAVALTFAVASCSNDEPTANGGAQKLSGRKVAFSTKVSLDGNKKIYLGAPNGSNIPVLWGSGDKVTIYTTGGAGNPPQMGVYTATTVGGVSSALAWADDAGKEIEWVESGSQSFYSVLGSNGTVDASGKQTLTVPAEQTGLVADNGHSNPTAVAFGSVTVNNVSSTDNKNVVLNYKLANGVIRLKIPAGDEISKVTFSDANAPLSGKINNYTGNAADAVTGGGDITVNLSNVTTGTTIDVYTLPRTFAKLAITVSGAKGFCTKAVPSTVAAGTVKAISFGRYTLTRPEFVMAVNEASTYTLTNKWGGTVNYSINGGVTQILSAYGDDIPLAKGDIVRVWESQIGVTFRAWRNSYNPLIKKESGSGGNVSLTSMPPMNGFTTDDTGKAAGSNFFFSFNYNGALTSLPASSFDISNIETVGDYFFYYFNKQGVLTSLPDDSFNTSKISGAVGNYFFGSFNTFGALTSLPANSFNTSKITKTGDYFFDLFNNTGALTSLPANSFDTSNVTKTGSFFFNGFNSHGQLTSLPKGSFITSNITNAGSNFFNNFNYSGRIETGNAANDVKIKNITSDPIIFYYWNGNNQNQTVAPNNTMGYKAQ